MIAVHTVLDLGEDVYRVEISGHAEYAPEGQDIVCAAVSALALALHSYLAAHSEVCICAGRQSGGHARFTFRRTRSSQAAYEMTAMGLSAIAAEYPDHVRIVREILR